jgi:hypothetical protein
LWEKPTTTLIINDNNINMAGDSIFSHEQENGTNSILGNWHQELLDKQAEELKKKEEAVKLEEATLNKVEIGFVRFLFKIRNANHSKILKENIIPNEILFTKNPDDYISRERVFIAGKIFPIMNSVISDDANAKIINLKTIVSFQKEFPVISGYEKLYSKKYISIDNDKIKILLPPNYADIDFGKLLLDFLTNGTKTAHTIGGEFEDYETYKLALREKAQPLKSWKGEDGCWLTKDRDKKTINWINGYSYIIKKKQQGWLAPFKQIYDFYNAVDGWQFRLGHRIKWCKGAKNLVNSLSVLDGGFMFIDNDVEIILNELNLGICDFAITQFHELIYGEYATSPLKGDDAYEWDKKFITYEQGTVAPPIYKKTNSETIKKFQKMADQDGLDSKNGVSSLGFGSFLLNDVTPAFDDFKPEAKVTDDLFRIDLPLLMLYLDTHKIDRNKVSPSLKEYLNSDGTVNQECKDIIKDFAL